MSRPLAGEARRVAEAGLAELESQLASVPPAGVDASEVAALFRRHRAALVQALGELVMSAMDRQTPSAREKFSDGRWVARPGDKVYSLAPGFGGSQAAIYGVVEGSRTGLQVRITGTGGFFPGTVKTKRTRYSPQWTVMDDPRPGELRAERLAREKAQEEQWRREQEDYEAEARAKAAAAVKAGETYLSESTPPGRPVIDHLSGRQGRLMRQSERGPIVRWRGGLEGDSTIGSPNDQGFWPTITVGDGEAPPDYLLLLQAEPHPAFNPTVHILPQWVPVESLADAQRKVASFIGGNKVGEGNWKGGSVTRDGEPFARIRYDGRIFDSLLGGEIDMQGRPTAREDLSLLLIRNRGRSLSSSDGPKVAGAPQADHVRSRIIEFISSQVGDKDSLADVKTVGLWESVRPKHLVDRIEAGARSGVLGYWYSRLSYHRPDLVPLYAAAVRRAGFVLPAAPEPIQWLRPALNAFLLSPAELAVIPTFYERSSLRSFLDDIKLPPPEPKRVASMLANGLWDRITAEELKPTLAWALRIGQEALEWLVEWLRFYRMDLMPALRAAANELDRDRSPKIIDEEREMALVDDEWAQLAPKLTARALGKLLKTAATKGVLPTVLERIQKHRPDLVSVVVSWRERMRKNE